MEMRIKGRESVKVVQEEAMALLESSEKETNYLTISEQFPTFRQFIGLDSTRFTRLIYNSIPRQRSPPDIIFRTELKLVFRIRLQEIQRHAMFPIIATLIR